MSSSPRRVVAAHALDAAAPALGSLSLLVGGRQLLMGESRPGLVLCLAAVLLVVLWLRNRRAPDARAVAVGLAIAFTSWCGLTIALASVRGPDGRVYFCLFDDAFVSMRYAWNLAHGSGLVWNPGERVEGYTNLLWTLLMAIPCRLLDRSLAALAMQLAGLLAVLATAVASWRLADRLGASTGFGAFAAVLATYPLVYWSVFGMEPGLLALLLTGATWAAVQEAQRVDLRVALLLGLAFATRPDALLACVAVLAYRAATTRPRAAAVEAAVFAAFPAAVALFRWRYYGSLVPNTYVLKVEGMPLAHRLQVGAGSALVALAWLAPAVALALFAVAQTRDRRRVLLLAVFAAALGAHVFVGGDAWPRWRFFCPTLPLVFVLAADGAARLAARTRMPGLTWAAVAVFTAVANGPFVAEACLARYPFGVREVQVAAVSASVLTRVCTPEATVGVFYAGAVPYFTGLRAVDFLGKTDPHVARLPPRLSLGPGHNKSDLAYSIGVLRPDYVEDFTWAADSALFARADYEKVRGLWLRRGSPRVRWALIRSGG